MSEPTATRSGIAPAIDPTSPSGLILGPTRLCGRCACLIRFWPNEQAWRHVIFGVDHPPELAGSWAPRLERDPPIVTESELRLMDGNR